MQNKITS